MTSSARVIGSCLAFALFLGCVPKDPTLIGDDAGPATSPDGGPGADAAGAPEAGTGPDGAGDAAVDAPDPVFASAEVIAERLAHMIWDTNADQGVVALLSTGISRRSVGEAASQMLADPRARAGVAAFFRWWLYFDESLKPSGEEGSLAAALRSEAPALGTYLTLDTEGTFGELLTAPYTFMNEVLAQHYGVADVSGPGLRRVPYPAGEPRIGLLTGAGILSFYASLVNPSWPAKRGWMVTDPMLCTPVIRSFLPSMQPDVTRSIRQQMLDATSVCGMTCHGILNSPGFAFIGFDSTGRWHPEPGAAPNETEGWISTVIMPDAPTFNGPAELAHLLVAREETRRCFVRQWMQFALHRDLQIAARPSPEDEASVEAALRTFMEAGLRLRAAIVAVAQTDAFLRAAAP